MEKQLPAIKIPQMPSVPKSKDIQTSFSADQKFQMVKGGFVLADKVIELAKIWIDGEQQSDIRKNENEKILLEIQKIDSEAAAFFRKAEASVLREKERTERMRLFCQLLEKKDYPPDVVERILLECLKIDPQ